MNVVRGINVSIMNFHQFMNFRGQIYFKKTYVFFVEIIWRSTSSCKPGFICLVLQSVSCSLSVMGFGESIMRLMNEDNPWIARGVAIALVLLLLGEPYWANLRVIAIQPYEKDVLSNTSSLQIVLKMYLVIQYIAVLGVDWFLFVGINVAGVKWVIRLQLILLFALFFSAMDLIVGSFVHTDIGRLGNYNIPKMGANTVYKSITIFSLLEMRPWRFLL